MGGREVAIATREAVVSDDLDRLEHEVLERFRSSTEEELAARTGAARLHLAAIQRLVGYLRPIPSEAGFGAAGVAQAPRRRVNAGHGQEQWKTYGGRGPPRSQATRSMASTWGAPLGRNLAMVGVLGWLIVAPTLLGMFIGRWLIAPPTPAFLDRRPADSRVWPPAAGSRGAGCTNRDRPGFRRDRWTGGDLRGPGAGTGDRLFAALRLNVRLYSGGAGRCRPSSSIWPGSAVWALP